MIIFLAARCSRRDEMKGYAHQLVQIGHVVSSRWIEGNHELDLTNPSQHYEDRIRFAREDVDDLCRSHMCVSFTERSRETSNSRGGRHVEFGIALGVGMCLVVIGHRENVFHYLPHVYFFDNFSDFVTRLKDHPQDFTEQYWYDDLKIRG